MTAYLMGAATLILLILIFWRRASPEFRKKSEQPKFQFLANLGIKNHSRLDAEPVPEGNPHATQKGSNEHHEP